MVQTEKLILLRKKNGFTQIKAAEKLQVSRQAISGWETGAVLPSLENLKSLSNLYGVSVDYLLNESPTETAPMEAENRVEVQTHSANIKRMLICSITVIAIVILISISILLVVNDSISLTQTSIQKIDEAIVEDKPVWIEMNLSELSAQ